MPTKVQQVDAGLAAGNSLDLVFGASTTAGNYLTVQATPWDGVGPPQNLPTGLGTWNTTTAPTQNGGGNAFINYNESCSAGTTITLDYGTGFYLEASACEWTGVQNSSSVREQTQNNGTSTTPTSGTTGGSTVAGDLVVACCQVSENEANVGLDVPATTGYTNIHVEQASNVTMGHASDFKTASAGAQSAAWGTLGGSWRWSAKIVVFKSSERRWFFG